MNLILVLCALLGMIVAASFLIAGAVMILCFYKNGKDLQVKIKKEDLK